MDSCASCCAGVWGSDGRASGNGVDDLGDVLNSNLGDFGISSVPLSLSLGLFVSLGLVGLVLILFLMLGAWLVLACCAHCRVAMANKGPKKTNRLVFGR